jgi:hypothetical protein
VSGQRHAHHRLVFINDDEPGLHHDYKLWFEKIGTACTNERLSI